jgi:hypothetical protein
MKTIPLTQAIEQVGPLPFIHTPPDDNNYAAISDAGGNCICVSTIEDHTSEIAQHESQQMAYLVHAANVLPELVDSLRRLALEIESIVAHEAGPTRDEHLERLHADHDGILRGARASLTAATTVPIP